MNLDKWAVHLQCDKYDAFWLTDAIRPGLDLDVVPQEGYRLETYRDERYDLSVPMLAASISRERLFDIFLELLGLLGESVDVVLESSHESTNGDHRDFIREEIDLPVLLSHFCDFEDLLLHDGCTGIAVISRGEPIEIQFDEHKLLLIYARDLKPFERILKAAGVRANDRLRLITEGTHLHNSDVRHMDSFGQLGYRLGVGEPAEQLSW